MMMITLPIMDLVILVEGNDFAAKLNGGDDRSVGSSDSDED